MPTHSVVSNLSWTAVGRVFRELLNLLIMLLMARYLAPADFGAYALVMLCVNFVSLFGSGSSAQLLIMPQGRNPELSTQLFYLNFCIGIVAYALLVLLSGHIANWFAVPALEPLLDVAGLAFILQAPVLVQRAVMERELRFGDLVKLEMLTTLVAGVLSIICLISGLGVYSLVVFNLAGLALLLAGLTLRCAWRPRGAPRVAQIRDVLPRVFDFTGFTLLNFLTRHADVFLIGRLLGSSALGIYSMAYRLTLYPVQALSQVVHRVAYPQLARLSEQPERARTFYLRALEGVSLLMFPALAGLGLIAAPLIRLILGESWIDVVPLVRILAWVGLLQVVTATVGTIYPALGRTRVMFRIGLLNSVVVIAAFILGVKFGLSGLAFAYLLANALMFLIQLRLAWPLLDITLAAGLRALTPALVSTLAMSVLLQLAISVLDLQGHASIWVLCLQVFGGGVCYLLSLRFLFPDSFNRCRSLLPGLSQRDNR